MIVLLLFVIAFIFSISLSVRVINPHLCLTEEHLRRKGIYFGDSKLVEKSNKMPMPSCDELEKFKMRGL